MIFNRYGVCVGAQQQGNYCLEIYSTWFLNFQALISCLLRMNATPTPVKYHKTSCILLLGKLFHFFCKLPGIDLPLDENQCNSTPFQYHKTSLILLLGTLFCYISNLPSIGFTHVEYQYKAILVHYHKTSCILLIRNSF